MTISLEQQCVDAFEAYARAGAAAYRMKYAVLPSLSHLCFKFSNPGIYNDYIIYADRLGDLKRQEFNGHEITWCKLNEPLRAGKLVLEWLEFVHPSKDPHHSSGVASVGYVVPGLAEVIKIPSANPDVMFRYQGLSAAEMAAQ